MTLSVLAAFWAVSFLLIITPGADWAYAISAGMRGRLVTPAVAGLLSGHLLATVVVAAGVGGLVASHPMILRAMTIAGSGYTTWTDDGFQMTFVTGGYVYNYGKYGSYYVRPCTAFEV